MKNLVETIAADPRVVNRDALLFIDEWCSMETLRLRSGLRAGAAERHSR